jgi:hypothetical protein
LQRKVLQELRTALYPWEILRNQIVDIGLQRKVLHGVRGRAGSDDQRNQENRQWARRAKRHERDDG